MIETLFIITALLSSGTIYEDFETCEEYKRDFLMFKEVEVGHMIFEYKNYPIDIQVMSTGKIPDEIMIPVAYVVPIENCIPIE